MSPARLLYLCSSGSKHNQEVISGLVKEVMEDPENNYDEEVVKCKCVSCLTLFPLDLLQ